MFRWDGIQRLFNQYQKWTCRSIVDIRLLVYDLLPREQQDWQTRAMTRIDSSLQPIRNALESISFLLEPEDWRDGSFKLIVLLVKLLSNLPQLVKIRIDAPSLASLEAGSGKKHFNLSTNDSKKTVEQDEGASIVSLMKEVKSFVGEGLSHFLLPHKRETSHQNESWLNFLAGRPIPENLERSWNYETVESSGILQELAHSRSSLVVLDLDIFSGARGKLVWEFFIKCTQLTSLSVPINYKYAHQWERTEEEKKLEVLTIPEQDCQDRKVKLQKLELTGGHYLIRWDDLSRWMGGNGLIDLSVVKDFIPSGLLAPLLLNSKDTLKSIELQSFQTDTPQNIKYSPWLLFPNLEFLSLGTSSDFLYLFFRDLVAPKLTKLWIDYEPTFEEAIIRQEDNSVTAFNCVLDILQSHSIRLVELRFDYSSARPNQPRGEFDLKFPKLEKLDFGIELEDENFAYWLSRSRFPKLISLSGVGSYVQRAFERRAPNLPKVELEDWEEEELRKIDDDYNDWWLLDDLLDDERSVQRSRKKKREYVNEYKEYEEEEEEYEEAGYEDEMDEEDWRAARR